MNNPWMKTLYFDPWTGTERVCAVTNATSGPNYGNLKLAIYEDGDAAFAPGGSVPGKIIKQVPMDINEAYEWLSKYKHSSREFINDFSKTY